MILLIVALVLGLLVGGVAAWFFASRPAAELRERLSVRDAEARELDEKFRRSTTELATMTERAARADALAADLDKARAENADFRAERAGFAEQKRLLMAAQSTLMGAGSCAS